MKYSITILLLVLSGSIFAQKADFNPADEYAYLAKHVTHYKNEQVVSTNETTITIMGNHKKRQLVIGENVISYKVLRVYDDTENFTNDYSIIECVAFDSDNKTLRLNIMINNSTLGEVLVVLDYMDNNTYFYLCEILY